LFFSQHRQWYNAATGGGGILNIIDTLSTAFNSLVKKIWLLVIPVALDLILWLGPKVALAPSLINDFMAIIRQTVDSTGASGQAASVGLVSSILPEMQSILEGVNLLTLLAWGRAGIPSISGILGASPLSPPVLPVRTPTQLVGIELAVLAIGLFLACIFIGLLSQVVKGESMNLGYVLRRAPTHWLYLVLLYVPLSILALAAVGLGSLLGPLMFLVLGGILWISLYLFFLPQAVILSDASPLEALRDSFIIVRLNFWSTLGLVILIYLISGGFGLIWGLLVSSPIGSIAAILANAFVGTGLLAASCYFYRDRMVKWQQVLQQHRMKA
jgi:hypothetical protein